MYKLYVLWYNGLCHVEVKLKFKIFYRPRAFNCMLTFILWQVVIIVLWQVVTIVLGQVVTTVTTLGRLVPMAQPASCVLTMTERKSI